MKTEDIILWTETHLYEIEKLSRAFESATRPIQMAYKGACVWDGPNLIFRPSKCCPAIVPTYYRDLYFYLSGYGDAMFQEGAPKRIDPRVAP